MLAAAVLLLLTGATYMQASTYKDAKTLWLHTTKTNPRAWIAWNNLGAIHLKDANLSEAESCFRQVLTLRPDYAQAQTNYGVVLIKQARYAEAVEHLRQAIKPKSDYIAAHLNLAKIYAQLSKYDLAIDTYRRTIALADASSLKADRRSRRIEALSDLSGVYFESTALYKDDEKTRRYALAASAAQRAFELARRYGRNDLADEIEPRLQKYRRLSNSD